MINNRFCTQEGYNKDQVTHLCMYEDCKLKNQQCCRLCITQGIHKHGKSDNQHIRLRQNIQNNQQILQLDKQDEQYKNVQSIDFKNRKYKLKQIDYGDDNYAASISNDEKYLAYRGHEIFKIFDLKEDKIIKQIKSKGSLKGCQFTSDSSLLFVAYIADQSLFIGYDVKMNFKKTFQYNIQTRYIDDIITIQNQYLMTSQDNNKIVKIDIKRKKQLFKLQNNRPIEAMDYDQNNNFLIYGSDDRSLKLWHCGNLKNIINKQQAHDVTIYRVQLINNIQNVLSLDYDDNLYKWKINLINNQLIKLEEYNHIFNFQQINQNQNLLLICYNCFQILDDKGQLVINIDHEYKKKLFYLFRMKIRQLDNARYVIIGSQRQIILASSLNLNILRE